MTSLLIVRPLGASVHWTLEVAGGTSFNIPTELVIRQSGYDDIILIAHYETKPLGMPPYYDVRIGRWERDRGWELELVHQKLYLVNKPPAVQNFAISHGYNLIDLSRAWRYRGFIFRLGGGLVLAHPETTVREKVWSDRQGFLTLGWFISGPTGQATIGKDLYTYKRLTLTAEAKFTGSYAWIFIQDGSARVPNVAFHGLLGLRYRF